MEDVDCIHGITSFWNGERYAGCAQCFGRPNTTSSKSHVEWSHDEMSMLVDLVPADTPPGDRIEQFEIIHELTFGRHTVRGIEQQWYDLTWRSRPDARQPSKWRAIDVFWKQRSLSEGNA